MEDAKRESTRGEGEGGGRVGARRGLDEGDWMRVGRRSKRGRNRMTQTKCRMRGGKKGDHHDEGRGDEEHENTKGARRG